MNGMHNSKRSLKERVLRTVFNDELLCTPRFRFDFSRAWNFLTKLIIISCSRKTYFIVT
jgi:hypothetical protein